MRGPLTVTQCDHVKQAVVDMLEECEIHTLPIDCYEIARKLHYVLRPYDTLSEHDMIAAYNQDNDGFSTVEVNQETGLYQYVIYYDDALSDENRRRWTIFHELGHIYLGHHDNPDDGNTEIEEAEADLFAKYAIAPLPLIRKLKCQTAGEIQETFQTSSLAASYIWDYYCKRTQYGPKNMESFEVQLVRMFNLE